MADINGVQAIASELGFTSDSQEESSSSEVVTESTEAEGEAQNEAVETEPENVEGSEETSALEEEEKPATEAPVVEEQKLTLKEFQEIQAKSDELAAKEKAFTDRMSAQEKEFQEKYHEKIKTHDQVDDFFEHLANKDPDLFDLVRGEFQEHQKQYSNPALNELKQKNAELEKKLDSFLNKASDQVTLNGLETEMSKFNQGLGKEAEAAGLKIDRKAIEDMWAKGLNVNEAFYAKYGEAFSKAQASKAKVSAVTKKVEARPTVSTAGNVNKSNAKTEASFKGMNTNDSIWAIAKQVTGKSFK